MNWFLNVGCGSMYPPVVHNCTAIEFDQTKLLHLADHIFRGID